MSLTNQQFKELLKGSIKIRKEQERQTISENLEKEGYSRYDYDDYDDYAPDNDDPDSGRHGSDNYTIGAYGDQVASRKSKLFQRKSTVPVHMDIEKGGYEDGLAGLEINGRYKYRPKYLRQYKLGREEYLSKASAK